LPTEIRHFRQALIAFASLIGSHQDPHYVFAMSIAIQGVQSPQCIALRCMVVAEIGYGAILARLGAKVDLIA
jgi:hypothetical protein